MRLPSLFAVSRDEVRRLITSSSTKWKDLGEAADATDGPFEGEEAEDDAEPGGFVPEGFALVFDFWGGGLGEHVGGGKNLAAGEGKIFAMGIAGEGGHEGRPGAEVEEFEIGGFGDEELMVITDEVRRGCEGG